ncbi:MAG: potassium-transporting ATPase subunit C [Flavonifractor plautii]
MKVIKSLRAPVLVTLVLLLICGLIYPVVMTLMSQALFPSQANGSIIYVDGQAVGAKNVGQDFTDPRFMRCRPSAYQYNTYTVDEEGNKFYNDGSEYAGVASGSNNYGASNPALAERVQGDIDEFLAEHPDLTGGHPHRPGDGLRFRPDPHISPASAAVQIPQLAENTGLTEEQLEQFVADNTTGKVLGIFGEETVNVLGVNLISPRPSA